MKKKGIIFLLFILVVSFVGYMSVRTNKVPKNVNEEVYKKSVKLLAYTERCFKNKTNMNGEIYLDYSNEIDEIYKNENRKETKEENNISFNLTASGWSLEKYLEYRQQLALDDYNDCIKKVKKALNIPIDKDSNEIWNKIKEDK